MTKWNLRRREAQEIQGTILQSLRQEWTAQSFSDDYNNYALSIQHWPGHNFHRANHHLLHQHRQWTHTNPGKLSERRKSHV